MAVNVAREAGREVGAGGACASRKVSSPVFDREREFSKKT